MFQKIKEERYLKRVSRLLFKALKNKLSVTSQCSDQVIRQCSMGENYIMPKACKTYDCNQEVQ